jgi:hypothetical protein
MSLEDGTESMMSGEGGSRAPDSRSMMSHDNRPSHMERGDSVLPNESASHHGDSPPQSALGGSLLSPEDTPFPFKFKSPSGRVHRVQVIASGGIEDLVSSVVGKLGAEVDSLGGIPTFDDGQISKSGFALSYLDNEGDTVSITTNHDLIEAIGLSRHAHREKVDLFVHHPDKAPLPATTEPQPGLAKPMTPPESVLRDRRQFFDDEEDVPRARSRGQASAVPKQQEEFIAGVPNDLLLPGAIVALAVVIVGVFAIGRASSR